MTVIFAWRRFAPLKRLMMRCRTRVLRAHGALKIFWTPAPSTTSVPPPRSRGLTGQGGLRRSSDEPRGIRGMWMNATRWTSRTTSTSCRSRTTSRSRPTFTGGSPRRAPVRPARRRVARAVAWDRRRLALHAAAQRDRLPAAQVAARPRDGDAGLHAPGAVLVGRPLLRLRLARLCRLLPPARRAALFRLCAGGAPDGRRQAPRAAGRPGAAAAALALERVAALVEALPDRLHVRPRVRHALPEPPRAERLLDDVHGARRPHRQGRAERVGAEPRPAVGRGPAEDDAARHVRVAQRGRRRARRPRRRGAARPRRAPRL